MGQGGRLGEVWTLSNEEGHFSKGWPTFNGIYDPFQTSLDFGPIFNNEDGRLGVFLLDTIYSSFEHYPPSWPRNVYHSFPLNGTTVLLEQIKQL